MHVLSMFEVGRCRSEAENAAGVSGLVCQLNIDEPIEDTIERYPIHFWERLLAQQSLNIAMAERPTGRVKKAENPDPSRGRACSSRTDGGLDSRKRRIGVEPHARIGTQLYCRCNCVAYKAQATA
jgi:hypothetical protein